MRRHAHAKGSTQRQAGRLGYFFRGILATRASSHGARGSSAPSPGLFGVGCLVILALGASFGGGAASASAAEECPNEIRRNEQGVFALRLPDCRAYEIVSPGSRPQVGSGGEASGIRATRDGNTVGYESRYPAAGEEHSGYYYLTRRGPGGWATHNVAPQESTTTDEEFVCSQSAVFSADLSKDALEQDEHVYEDSLKETFCSHSEVVLDPRETWGYRSIFVHDLASDSYELASLNEAEGAPGNSYFRAGSDDFSTIAFESEAQLTPEAPGVTPGVKGGWNNFVWSEGAVRLATILPDGTPVQSELAQRMGVGQSPEFVHAVSADGSKLFFAYGGAIYMRVNPAQPQSALSGGVCTEPAKACTVQVDKSQGPGASGGGVFELATPDGSKVFFTSDHRLTADSTAVAGKEDLYEYDTETSDLTDLTVNASEPADVWAVSDISEDGSYVYFVAEAALEGSGAPAAGNCKHYFATSTCNLYVEHEGAITYIASLSVDDTSDFFGERYFGGAGVYDGHLVKHHVVNALHAESSASGRFFAFNTVESINGEGEGIYLYDAGADEISCVTCGDEEYGLDLNGGAGAGIEPMARFAGGTAITAWKRNQVLDDGSVLFSAKVALVPADTNEAPDVYMYKNGQLFLVSTGVDSGSSAFLDATPSGSDVYFGTAAGLVPSDTDGSTTLYDARVNGGFAEPPPLPGCEGEACRGAGSAAPVSPATGTASFQGPGNQAQKHKADCGLNAKRAQKLAREAKSLRRRAKQAGSEAEAKRLRRQAAQLAKQGQSISKSAKRCRRANRGAGK